MRRYVPVLLCLAAFANPVRAQDDPKVLAAQARRILETTCFRCHGKDGGKGEGGFGYVLDLPRMIERKKVVPGNPGKSRLLQRALLGEDDEECMPPKGEKPRPTKQDLALLQKWIEVGAPEFPAEELAKRPFLTETYMYKAMYDHLFNQHPDHAKFQRYFTLTHLHNNPRVRDEQLRYYRAGVSKLLNSLSWRRASVLPVPIDKHETILAFDLRDLDWDILDNWTKLIGHSDRKGQEFAGYPYGITHDKYPEEQPLNRLAEQVYKLSGTLIPAVRADWFLATASVPPLYHDLLYLPLNAFDLERQLKVDVALNFKRDRLARAGFNKSGVSAKANRLVERHDGLYGAYWKSYDFRIDDGLGNLFRFPLGPLNLFPEHKHPYPDQAFVHDGGEIIFALPNGLHAYLLVDGNDRRIDEGPADVVRDKNEFAGKSTIVVNGLSCMGCHRYGMISEFRDEVRAGAGLLGGPRDKMLRLYPEHAVMQRLLESDETDFLVSLDRVTAPYLRVGPDKDKSIKDFPEMVSSLASPYLKGNVILAEAAWELGMENPDELRFAIKNNPILRDRLGLKTLIAGGNISRTVWESILALFSPFQETAAQTLRGTPVRIRRNYDLP